MSIHTTGVLHSIVAKDEFRHRGSRNVRRLSSFCLMFKSFSKSYRYGSSGSGKCWPLQHEEYETRIFVNT